MYRIDLAQFLLIAEAVTPATTDQLLHGYCDLAKASAAISAPFAGYGDVEVHEHLYQKAAAYCSRIVRYHPLIDGNKRAGYATMRMFISLNGYDWEHGIEGQDETVRAVEFLAAGTVSEYCFENWVGKRMKRR